MSIFKRVVSLFKGQANSILDELEKTKSSSEQLVRELKESLNSASIGYRDLLARRELLEGDLSKVEEQLKNSKIKIQTILNQTSKIVIHCTKEQLKEVSSMEGVTSVDDAAIFLAQSISDLAQEIDGDKKMESEKKEASPKPLDSVIKAKTTDDKILGGLLGFTLGHFPASFISALVVGLTCLTGLGFKPILGIFILSYILVLIVCAYLGYKNS